MPATLHIEHHFNATATVRDIVIGMSDGLTVPFALAAGISGAGAATNIVVTAGLAEIAAGAISMGLGGYLAARTDQEHYEKERQREVDETVQTPDAEKEEVAQIFREYGLSEAELRPIVDALSQDRDKWVDFMMRYELGLEKPEPRHAQRPHHCALLHSGRFDPAFPLHFASEHPGSLAGLRRRHDVGVVGFWLCERPLHRHPSVSVGGADRVGGWGGRHGCIHAGALDWIGEIVSVIG